MNKGDGVEVLFSATLELLTRVVLQASPLGE